MWRKSFLGWLLVLALTACDSGEQSASVVVSTSPEVATTLTVAPRPDPVQLAERYRGQDLTVLDLAELEEDGASVLALTFSMPLLAEQNFAQKIQVVDSENGLLDGAWELSDDLMMLRLRHIPPQRHLIISVDAGLQGINQTQLAQDYQEKITTRNLQPSVGFASRGSLLPAEFIQGLPVVALNVKQVDVEFFRVKTNALPEFLSQWGSNQSLDTWEAQELLSLAELVHSARFELNPQANTRETIQLPIKPIASLNQSGVYLAVMRQAGTYNYSHPATVFSISDIGVSVHRYSQQLDVFTQALSDGIALEAVKLQVLDKKGRSLTSTKTNKQGHAQLPLTDKADVLVAQLGQQTSFLRLNSTSLDLAEFAIDGPKGQALQLFVFGPRDLYRPGETVLLNALLRDADGQKVDAQPIKVTVRRPDQQVSREFVWQANNQGFYQYELPISASAPTGRWQLLFDLGGGIEQFYDIQVEEFLPERLALELQAHATPIKPQADLVVNIEGRYLYGAPAAGNNITGQLYVRALRDAVSSLPGFKFGSVLDADKHQDLDLDELVLDQEGRAQFYLESQWVNERSPLSLTVQASVLESAGRPVVRQVTQAVWPAAQLPGIRAVFNGDEVDADSEPTFEIVLANSQGDKLAAEELKVRLVRERRDYYWSYSESSGWSHNYNKKYLTVSEQKVAIEAGSTTNVSFPVQWGPYRVEVEDPRTQLVSSVSFWAGYAWQDNALGGAVRPDQVRLTLDKPAYANGDVARVSIDAPAAGSGYLLVESTEGPLWWQPLNVPAGGTTVEIPIAEDWLRHDMYINALVVRPGKRQAQVTPKRAVGLLHLPLQRHMRQLDVALNSVEKMRPNQPLTVKVKAKLVNGQVPRQPIQVLLSAVDIGVLNITDFAAPDPFSSFFSRKGYQVDQFDVYGQLIESSNGRLARTLFGGDAQALPRGGQRPPTTVNIVALQSAPVTLNKQGEGEITVDVPDFNGRLRVTAQAWTDSQFGMAQQIVEVAAPLVAELSAPRFLAGGDHSQVALDLHNLTEKTQNITVQLRSNGLLKLEPTIARQQVQLAAQQRKILKIPVQALAGFGQGVLELEVDGMQLPDEKLVPLKRSWMLGVRPAYPAQTRSIQGVFKSAQSWQLPPEVLAGYQAGGLQAVLSVSARPPLNIGEHLRALDAYPYGCSEQTVSGLMAALYIGQLQGSSDAIHKRRKQVELGIERLLAMQRYNGSFAMWSAGGREAHWATVYVTDFLLRAREQGYAVPLAALKSAQERLLRYMQEGYLIDTDYSEAPESTRFAVQAYAGFVLARDHRAPLGALRSLFERRQHARSGLPLVHLALALQWMGDAPKAEQALHAGLGVQRSDQLYMADYGSELRDQAQILALLQEYNLAPSVQAARTFELADELHMRRGLSTQERNALFMAARGQLLLGDKNWQALLHTAGRDVILSPENSQVYLAAEQLQKGVMLSTSSEEDLYQRMEVTGYPARAPQAGGNVLSIERQYFNPQGEPLQLHELRSGDLVLVHLAVRASREVPDALIVDLLPAGLELENQNLARSSAGLSLVSGALQNWHEAMQGADIVHQEYRDDRYVAALAIPAQQPQHLLYLARAVTPGQYLVPPAQVESMYRPEWQALSSSVGQMHIAPR
ncbi:alpha-2-macroglobulin [Denitrificimonas sp. JX-1]|uniref:Alpha-2-macroglobulin n=1 Tax=Denitrificimonas halotolerans TaxID=3098930 RepID=A0ABU5GPS1_9GAMM|nr:alpha-2-macroglobulin [Denitrificimonas sp. JX-1]MDY7218990.1 alpha-2-macroglobulin [Denitrificimonas sp. JX-1]